MKYIFSCSRSASITRQFCCYTHWIPYNNRRVNFNSILFSHNQYYPWQSYIVRRFCLFCCILLLFIWSNMLYLLLLRTCNHYSYFKNVLTESSNKNEFCIYMNTHTLIRSIKASQFCYIKKMEIEQIWNWKLKKDGEQRMDFN